MDMRQTFTGVFALEAGKLPRISHVDMRRALQAFAERSDLLTT